MEMVLMTRLENYFTPSDTVHGGCRYTDDWKIVAASIAFDADRPFEYFSFCQRWTGCSIGCQCCSNVSISYIRSAVLD
jgi:hypothetical protein